MSEWRPIETAPLGTPVLIWMPDFDHYYMGCVPLVAMKAGSKWLADMGQNKPGLATHWMPLPAPPDDADLPAGNSATGPGGSAQQIAGNVTDED